MWNFGIPYKLKHYIDVLTQPGQTFNFDPTTGYGSRRASCSDELLVLVCFQHRSLNVTGKIDFACAPDESYAS
jgi:putative NADPH-quinone reductase